MTPASLWLSHFENVVRLENSTYGTNYAAEQLDHFIVQPQAQGGGVWGGGQFNYAAPLHFQILGQGWSWS